MLMDKVLETLLEPFQTWEHVMFAVTNGIRSYTIDWQSKTALPYMASSLVIAWIIYRVDQRSGRLTNERSFLRFVCPREVYLHASAIIDYKFVAIDLSVKLLLYAPLISGVSWVLYKGMYALLQPLTLDVSATSPFTIAFIPGIVGVLLGDFGFFLSHYLMHKIPFLWPFHEVHHSAEVLTPVTVHRVHPVEDLVNVLVAGCISAAGAATYSSLSSQEVGLVTIFGVNVLFFVYFAFAFQLRHSHVWLAYGPVFSRILISPAQHQIHHSLDPKHWNKNFGFIFAVWDAMWGSLYVPRSREALQFGLSYADPQDFASVRKLYFLPFVKSIRALGAGRRVAVKTESAARK